MTAEGLSAWRLAGPPAALTAALDWLFVHADVRGVAEDARFENADSEKAHSDQDNVEPADVEPASLETGGTAAGGGDPAVGATVYLAGACPPLPVELGVAVRAAPLPVRDCAPTGLEHDRAIVVAPDLVVRPPWVESPRGFAGIELVVPRGNAFGSGEHDSTQAALLVLHELWSEPASCADVGTGSGILLAYAAARGCPGLAGCDLDPVAVRAARELLPTATLAVGGPEVLAPAACVIANLNGQELSAALPAILALWAGADRLGSGGTAGPLVLSGMRGAAEVTPIRARLGRPPDRELARGAFTALGYRAASPLGSGAGPAPAAGGGVR